MTSEPRRPSLVRLVPLFFADQVELESDRLELPYRIVARLPAIQVYITDAFHALLDQIIY